MQSFQLNIATDIYLLKSMIEDLGWNRLGLRPSEMMEVMEDREVWRLNLELMPPQLSQKSGQ